MHNIKKAAITREGFEYQDLLGMQYLVDMYIDPSLYEWIQLDSEDNLFQHVDDIVAKRKDNGKYVCRQVKFRVEPERKDLALSFEWLVEVGGKTERSTSLVQKWAKKPLLMQENNEIHDVKLLTNAIPDSEMSEALNSDGFIDFNKIPKKYKEIITSQLGGKRQAENFFSIFQIEHSKPARKQELAKKLRDKLIPYFTDESGWFNLQHEVKNWSIYKSSPEPDGRIKFHHISQIISKERPSSIPQSFSIPKRYRPPEKEFHRSIINSVKDTGIIVITGSPGRGKSTYISYLVKLLGKMSYPVIRHHYFLSLEDLTSERYTFHTVASSLLSQMKRLMPDTADKFKKSDMLKKCIQACANELNNKPLVLVIDGLDHVWRENSNIDQMRTLFNRLLPLPDNVTLIIGTQDVPEDQLSAKLLIEAPKEKWITLPLMNQLSIRHWLVTQNKLGSISCVPNKVNKQKKHLDNLAEAFHNVSGGHPLHLVYSFENLVAQSKEMTIDAVENLPKCPEGDIRKYYESLWIGLPKMAKEILHLFAATDFYWPENGLYECIGYNTENIDSFSSIRHLLERRSTGLVPFHGSVLVYIKLKEDHVQAAKRLLPKAVAWLENKAPNYWRWAWLWLTEAQTELEKNILSLPSRQWAIDALCNGYPIEQMELILKKAEQIALRNYEYSRLQELNHLRIRLINCADHQTDQFDVFQQCISFSSNDLTPFELMIDNISLISDQELVTVANRFKTEKPEVPINCLSEMNRRMYIKHKLNGENNFNLKYDAITLIELASFVDDVDLSKIIDISRRYKQNLFEVFQHYLKSLFIQKKLVRLLGLWKLKMPMDMCKLLVKTIVRLSCLEQLSLEKRNISSVLSKFPLSRCWLKIVKNIKPLGVGVEATKLSYDSDSIKLVMHEHFFLSLDASLNSGGNFSFLPINLPDRVDQWVKTALISLQTAAQETAVYIKEGCTEFALEYLFDLVDELIPPDERKSHDSYRVAQSFRVALVEISFDLFLLFSTAYGKSHIEFEDIKACKDYTWWNNDIWYEQYMELQLTIMTESTAKKYFKNKMDNFKNNISEFIDRTNAYIKLSKFALLHELENDLAKAIKLSANNLIGYGGHKDVSIFQVIDAIKTCNDNSSVKTKELLKKIKPVVRYIADITDGDETRHTPSNYFDLLAKVEPYSLIEMRSDYLSEEEWKYADQIVLSLINFSDLEDPNIIHLLETIISEDAIYALQKRGENGNIKALSLFNKQSKQIGYSSLEKPKQTKTSKIKKIEADDESLNIGWSCFPPNSIDNFIEYTKSKDWSIRKSIVKTWVKHWVQLGIRDALLEDIYNTITNSISSNYIFDDVLDDIYELSKRTQGKEQAYKWLVLAHIKNNGWNSAFGGAKAVNKRIELAAKEYPKKWKEYIQDTSIPKYGNKNQISIGQSELIKYLFMVKQNELAEKITNTLVNITIEEMADQPLGLKR